MEKKRGAGPALLALISQGASTPLLFLQSNGISIPRENHLRRRVREQYGRFVSCNWEFPVGGSGISESNDLTDKKHRAKAEGNHMLRFDDLVTDRVSDEFTYRMQLQFAHNVGAVGLRGFHAYTQRRRHFFAALAFGEELHDFALPGS